MTHMVTHQTDKFEFPPIDAGGHSAQRGFVDEALTLESGPLDTLDDEDIRPVRVSVTRSADNDPKYGEAELRYEYSLLIGEPTEWGYPAVVGFDHDQAERFAELFATAVRMGAADRAAHATFLGEVA